MGWGRRLALQGIERQCCHVCKQLIFAELSPGWLVRHLGPPLPAALFAVLQCQLAPWNTPVGCQLRSKNKACSKCTSGGWLRTRGPAALCASSWAGGLGLHAC